MKKSTTISQKKPGTFMRKKMDAGGWMDKNQEGFSSAAGYGAATIDAFAPTDAYGVRSNGAALGSGALSGAGKGASVGAAFGPEGALIGAGVGAVVGGVSGVLGNKAANKKKTNAINLSTTAQLGSMNQAAEARVAGDPTLKYGRMSASYYRFGGTMKGSGPTPQRIVKPIAAVQSKPRLMPSVAEVPARQMSRMDDGGGIHIKPENKGKFTATKEATGKSTEELTHSSNPVTKKRAIFAQNASKWNHKADGGQIEPLSTEDVKINGPSHDAGGVKIPAMGVELEGGETVNNGFVFSKKLGFAKPAEKIAKALGKAQQRPENSINTATVNALQRKTEFLKAQQEAAKAAVGIPSDLTTKANGGPIMKRDTSVSVPLSQAFPTITQSVLQRQGGTTGVQVNPIPIDPTRSFRDYEMGVPGRNLPVNPSPVEIKSPTGRYKFGGKIKKMEDGGDPDDVIINGGPRNPNAGPRGNYNIPSAIIHTDPLIPFPGSTTQPVVATSATPPTAADQISNGFAKAAPFLSNFYNSTQKLPLPPIPQLNDEITPNLVDYSASRAEAVRSARGADASARQNLNSGAAVSATKAANLSQQVRSIGQINEAENNANTSIRNQTAAQNAGIKAGNTTLQNNYNNELVERQIKGQNLKSANMANIEEKVQGMAKDKKLFEQEGEKAILGYMQNNDSGAGYDVLRPILAKHFTPDQLTQSDKWAANAKTERAAERADNMKNNKLQLDYYKKKYKNDPDNIFDTLGNISSVASSKEDNAADKTKRK